MGKSKKPKIEVTEYFLSHHLGICHAELDALLEVQIKEKVAFSGSLSTLTAQTINQPELFGGLTKEGGVSGVMHYLPGAQDQVLPDALAQKLGRANGADAPGYRGLASIFFVGNDQPGFYWTANSPFLPGVWAKLQRIFKRADGSAQWYAAKAAIPVVAAATEPYLTTTFDLDAITDAATSSSGLRAHGNKVTTQQADDILRITANHAGAYIAWSPWGAPVDTGGNNDGSTMEFDCALGESGTSGLSFDSQTDADNLNGYEAARADWEATYPNGATATGSTAYYFGIVDSPISDNTGGVSITVDVFSGGFYDMNPAHIIHECLTDTSYGMGTPVAALDDAAFTAAADTLFDESFGMSLLWTRQSSIQDFIQEILDHIQGVLYVDPATGLLTLSLIRGDYDEGTLDVLDPDNADLTNFSRKLWGDIVNEIIVTWTNPENEQEETITVQDDSSIATQGGIVSDSRNYYGVRNAQLAMDLAMRDLRSAGQPLASCEAEVDRSQWALRPASVIKLTWPEYGLSELVMRVQSVDYGKPGEPMIKLLLMEDVYGLDIGSYDAPPSSEWVDPSADPSALETVDILTLPYFFSLDSSVSAFVDSPEYPEVLSGVLATTTNSDTYAYQLWDEVVLPNGSTEWQSLGTLNVIGYGELSTALAAEAATASVSFSNVIGNTSPTVGGFVIIGDAGETGNEIAMVDVDDGDYDLVRGVLDTIPRAWPAGTPVWFIDGSTVYEDSVVRSAAETVSYKLRSQTSQGLLALADAPLESATLTERPWLPNRPANVTAHGGAWSTQSAPIDAITRADSWVTVTWAIRNRIDEDVLVLAWTDASGTAETGQTTTIEVRDLDGVLLTTHDGLTGTSFDVPDASFSSEQIVELRTYSERTDADGDFVSLQYFSHWVQVAALTFDSTQYTMDSTAFTMDQE